MIHEGVRYPYSGVATHQRCDSAAAFGVISAVAAVIDARNRFKREAT